jgi:hypothetical protein
MKSLLLKAPETLCLNVRIQSLVAFTLICFPSHPLSAMKLFRTKRRRKIMRQLGSSRRRLAVQLLESRRLLAGDTYYVDSVNGNDTLAGDSE